MINHNLLPVHPNSYRKHILLPVFTKVLSTCSVIACKVEEKIDQGSTKYSEHVDTYALEIFRLPNRRLFPDSQAKCLQPIFPRSKSPLTQKQSQLKNLVFLANSTHIISLR